MMKSATPKHVCFISIFDLTVTQHELAVRLAARGHHCVWMTTDPKWTRWLTERGVPRGDILELVFTRADFLGAEARAAVVAEMAVVERSGERTVNMSLIADRFVMSTRREAINDYACLYFHHIHKFLLERKVDVVFGEPTNTNEMIAAMICEHVGIPFLYPQTLRFPRNRFFFERGVATGQMVSSEGGHADTTAQALLARYRETKSHPDYFYANNRRRLNVRKNFQSMVRRLKGAADAKNNLTHHRFLLQLGDRVRMAVNRTVLLNLYRYSELDAISGKIAFFGLHVQPEASIDVMGPYFSDQLKLIKDMRRALPFDTTLVIKEHPNFLGRKPLRFFRELGRVPNVLMVHPNTSSFDIYKRASVVLTVSGTTAYEAGMLGIPAITFSKTFFSGFSSVHHCPHISQLQSLAAAILNSPRQADPDADERFMTAIIERSYPGYWGDPRTSPHVTAEENLAALTKGVLDVVENVVLQEPHACL